MPGSAATDVLEIGAVSQSAGSDPRVARWLRAVSMTLSAVAAAAAVGVILVRVLVTASGGEPIDDDFFRTDVFIAVALAASAAAVLAASGSQRVMLGIHKALCLCAGAVAVWSLTLAGLAVAFDSAGGVSMETAVALGLCAVSAAALATPRLTVLFGQGAAAAAITLTVASLASMATELGAGEEVPLVVAVTVPAIAVAALFSRPRLGAMRVLSASGKFGSLSRKIMVAAVASPFVVSLALTEISARQLSAEERFGAFAALLLVLLGGFSIVPLSAAASAVKQAATIDEQRRRDIEASADARELTAALADELECRVSDAVGWQLDALSEPASGYLAGDVVFSGSDGNRMWVVVLDVTGHGPRAALFASWAKQQLRAALANGDSAADAVCQLERVCRSHDEVATAFVGVGDASGNFRYVSAGHPPAVVAGGSHVERLDATGPLLGAWSESWEERAVEIRPGACVVVVSDGVLESRSRAGVEWGSARLESIALHRVPEGGAAVAEAVMDDSRAHTNGRYADDATVVVISRKA